MTPRLVVAVVAAVALTQCKRSENRATSGADAALAETSHVATEDAALASNPKEARDAGTKRARLLGPPRTATHGLCAEVADGKDDHLVAPADLRTSFVDGDDLLAVVNRSPEGQLAPDWAPSDLVEVPSGIEKTASACEGTMCLRREAAAALGELLAEMKAAGFPGKVESAFRSYAAQCWTFLGWEKKGSFCNAVEQSALPGHSQHQLGTAVDLFTEEWSDLAKDAGDERGVFRGGFGCSPGGKYLREHAPDFGFVLPYPIHPDDRHPDQSCVPRWDIVTGINPKTGYKNEAWHLRYVGKEAAKRFLADAQASGPGTANELSLEQWLRREHGAEGADVDLPVCDGCNCGACSTLAPLGESACDKKGGALHLDGEGAPIFAAEPPTIEAARLRRSKEGALLLVTVRVPRGTATQPPITGQEGASYTEGASYLALAPYPATSPRAFPPLEGAWVLGVTPFPETGGPAWPVRAALVETSVGRLYNKANVLLPAREGESVVRITLPGKTTRVSVTLLRGGVPRGEVRTVDLAVDGGAEGGR